MSAIDDQPSPADGSEEAPPGYRESWSILDRGDSILMFVVASGAIIGFLIRTPESLQFVIPGLAVLLVLGYPKLISKTNWERQRYKDRREARVVQLDALLGRLPAVDAASGERSEVVRELEDLRAQSAELAHHELASAFQDYRVENIKAGVAYMMWGASALATSAGLAFYLISDLVSDGATASIGQVIARSSIVLPGLALFAVLARESRHRREQASWAGLTAVQVQQIGGYLKGVQDDEVRNRIQLQLGLAVFSGGDALAVGSGTSTPRSTKLSVAQLEALEATLSLLRTSGVPGGAR